VHVFLLASQHWLTISAAVHLTINYNVRSLQIKEKMRMAKKVKYMMKTKTAAEKHQQQLYIVVAAWKIIPQISFTKSTTASAI
jgi:hypothetical protein